MILINIISSTFNDFWAYSFVNTYYQVLFLNFKIYHEYILLICSSHPRLYSVCYLAFIQYHTHFTATISVYKSSLVVEYMPGKKTTFISLRISILSQLFIDYAKPTLIDALNQHSIDLFTVLVSTFIFNFIKFVFLALRSNTLQFRTFSITNDTAFYFILGIFIYLVNWTAIKRFYLLDSDFIFIYLLFSSERMQMRFIYPILNTLFS